MRRTLLVVTLGVAVGVATHLGYYRAQSAPPTDTLDGQLTWMRAELHLTDAQYARIRELHQASSPRLRALATQVAQLQDEFAAFERTRRTDDRVDFLEFARFVEERRQVSRECLDSTRKLILAAAEVLTPTQRQQYLRIIGTAEPRTLPLMD